MLFAEIRSVDQARRRATRTHVFSSWWHLLFTASPLSLIVRRDLRILPACIPRNLALQLHTLDIGSEVPEIAAWVAGSPGYPPQHDDVERSMLVAMGGDYHLESLSIWADHPQLPWIWMSHRPRHLQVLDRQTGYTTRTGPSGLEPTESEHPASPLPPRIPCHLGFLGSWAGCCAVDAASSCYHDGDRSSWGRR